MIKKLQKHIDDSGFNYQLKTNEDLKYMIIDFGFGELLFHTADIERLLVENEHLKKKIEALNNNSV